MPVGYEEGDICYCVYVATPNNNPDSLLETFNNSRASVDVLKTCIKLHKANNLKEAMESVISDIRNICKAEGCTICFERDGNKIIAYTENDGIYVKCTTEVKVDVDEIYVSLTGDQVALTNIRIER